MQSRMPQIRFLQVPCVGKTRSCVTNLCQRSKDVDSRKFDLFLVFSKIDENRIDIWKSEGSGKLLNNVQRRYIDFKEL